MEQILYQKSWANKSECASYSVLPDLRKVIASFDVFQAFPVSSSYKSGVMVEKSVKPQNDRIECTHKPMWQVIWNIIVYKSSFSSNVTDDGFTQDLGDLQEMKESFYPMLPDFLKGAVLWKAPLLYRLSLRQKQYVGEMNT